MSELQAKLGGGLNKIQDSLQQGKQKIQTAQEIGQYRKIIQESGSIRGQALMQLGEEVYRKIRSGELHSENFSSSISSITESDVKIYQAQSAISLLNQKSGVEHACSTCGTAVTEADKFCGSCGSPVEISVQEEAAETAVCPSCEQQIPAHASFCTCCGTHLV